MHTLLIHAYQSETLRATLTCAYRRAREERICARLEQVVCLVVKDTPSTFPPWTKLSGKCLYSNSSVLVLLTCARTNASCSNMLVYSQE